MPNGILSFSVQYSYRDPFTIPSHKRNTSTTYLVFLRRQAPFIKHVMNDSCQDDVKHSLPLTLLQFLIYTWQFPESRIDVSGSYNAKLTWKQCVYLRVRAVTCFPWDKVKRANHMRAREICLPRGNASIRASRHLVGGNFRARGIFVV